LPIALKADCKRWFWICAATPAACSMFAVRHRSPFFGHWCHFTRKCIRIHPRTVRSKQQPHGSDFTADRLGGRDTASAAESLAGALKENKRARVVGQTTFGKGCSQGLWTLPTEGQLRTPPRPPRSAFIRAASG